MPLHQTALSIDITTQGVKEKSTNQGTVFQQSKDFTLLSLEMNAMCRQPRLQLSSPLKPLKQFLLHEDISKLASERLTFLKIHI